MAVKKRGGKRAVQVRAGRARKTKPLKSAEALRTIARLAQTFQKGARQREGTAVGIKCNVYANNWIHAVLDLPPGKLGRKDLQEICEFIADRFKPPPKK